MYIDLQHILPKAPKWVLRWLNKLLHIPQINTFLERHGSEEAYTFIQHALDEELHCSLQVICEIPTDNTPYVFVSNHPLGGLDGILLAYHIHAVRQRPLKILVNDFLLNIPPLKPLFVPVNKVGTQKREYVKSYHEMWDCGNDILTFPAGLCSRKQFINHHWVIQDLPWKQSVFKKAQEYQRPICKIHFEGRNSNRFYNVALIRKWLHIKFNIEMLLLPDEMYRSVGKTFTATFEKI